MSQHDFNISNQTASVTRADINNALGALATLSSGTTAPSTTYANMLWYETDTNTLQMRNEANSGWIRLGYLNQSGAFSVFLGTEVVDDSFTVVGSVDFQTTGSWEAGTSFDISLVSPAQVKAAIKKGDLGTSASNGYMDIGSNRMQWGSKTVNLQEGVNHTVTFPTPFSSNIWNIQATIEINSGAGMDAYSAYVRTKNTSSFMFNIASNGAGSYGTGVVHWTAIGN